MEYSGFFPSYDGDREYDYEYLANFMAAIAADGVYNAELAVHLENHNVVVSPGRAWIKGYFYISDTAVTLPLDAENTAPRVDNIVLRWDKAARTIRCMIAKGDPKGGAAAPTRTGTVYDLVLARVTVRPNWASVYLTDCRYDTSVCGITADPVRRLDTTELDAQMKTLLKEYRTWSEALERNSGLYSTMKALQSVFEDIIAKYTGEFRATVNGSLGEGDTEYTPAADLEGDLLLVSNDWGMSSKWSPDGGLSWLSTKPYDDTEYSIQCDLLVGGDRFLLMDDSYMVWGRVKNGELVWGAPLEYSANNNTSPAYLGGEFFNGFYAVLPQARDYVASPSGRDMLFFTAGSKSPRLIHLPHSRMVATAVTYDPSSGYYLAGGRYAYAHPEDEYNHKSWIAMTKNLETWRIVREDFDHDTAYRKILVCQDLAVAVPQNRNGLLIAPVTELAQGGAFEEVPLDGWVNDGVSSSFGVTLLGDGKLYHSADGKEYRASPVSVDTPGCLAGSGRLVLACGGNKYAVYRTDLTGEGLLETMETALGEIDQAKIGLEIWKKGITTELETAAGRKIVLTDTDPGVGADLEPGTVLFVYEGG